ncbi:unnamed protein product [Rhizophagus irregularis]|nr:unnamed protein product [Rhizophagus irregularis]
MRLSRLKKNSLPTALCVTKWIERSPDIPLMALAFAVKDQETIKESLSLSLFKMIIPLASILHVPIFSIWFLPPIHLQMRDVMMKKNLFKCKLTTRNHYYNAHIQFSDANSITQFEDIWAIICLGNSLRVCPASYPKSQRDSRREHVAIFAEIPKNIKEADLLDIASQVNTKAINIPLSYNSYKPKPYAYFNFASFENLKAAKELTIAFRGKGLSWHSPNEARELCHICGRQGCSPF